MRCVLIILTSFLLWQYSSAAQQLSGMEAIMAFLDTDDPEDMNSDDVERLEHLLESPVHINQLDRLQLRSCGLFSAYQIAVLEDYVRRHGAICSFHELSLLDGFGERFTQKVAPFVSLDMMLLHPSAQSPGVRHELATRGSYTLKERNADAVSYAMKYRVDVKGRITGVFAVARGTSANTWAPDTFSGSISWQSARVPLRLIAGDFNARFGQGLTLWNNSFISSLTTPDTFMKKPSGVSQPWSFTGSNALTGLAAEYRAGKFFVSTAVAFPGLKSLSAEPGKVQFMPAVNVAWQSRSGQISMTNVMYADMILKSGLDAAFCIRGVNLFGEFAYDWTEKVPSAVAGSRFKVGENADIALQARSLKNDEHGGAVSGMFNIGKRSQGYMLADLSYYTVPKEKSDLYSLQFKSQMAMEMIFSDSWTMKVRLTERIRTWGHPFRTDARADVIYVSDPFMASMRVNVLNCDGTGILSYIEGGIKRPELTLYLRQGIFFIDDWDDRIYVYERDAPGSFNVPAMYGRGVWTSLAASSRIVQTLRVYARASYVCYPFMEKKKPGKAELKLQLQYRF